MAVARNKTEYVLLMRVSICGYLEIGSVTPDLPQGLRCCRVAKTNHAMRRSGQADIRLYLWHLLHDVMRILIEKWRKRIILPVKRVSEADLLKKLWEGLGRFDTAAIQWALSFEFPDVVLLHAKRDG